jgi:hypothetical protein
LKLPASSSFKRKGSVLPYWFFVSVIILLFIAARLFIGFGDKPFINLIITVISGGLTGLILAPAFLPLMKTKSMKISLLWILFGSAFVSCQSKQHKQENESAKKDTVEINVSNPGADTLPPQLVFYKNDTLVEGDEQTVYIQSLFKTKDTFYLDADYIEFLTGDEAFDAAGKQGDLDTSYTSDGKMSVGVPNDYYILNENKKTTRLPLSKNVVIETIFWGDDTYYLKRTSIDSLYKQYLDQRHNADMHTPFALIMRDAVIVKIQEIYIP